MHKRGTRKNIAVIGTGISGMSAAWLLSQHHNVTVYEKNSRIGGHSNTITVRNEKSEIPVDTGFIVYNELTYPNLTALFDYLKVETEPSNMSLAISLQGGEFEYSGGELAGLFAQKKNLFRPRFWSMLKDLRRFYRDAPKDLVHLDDQIITLKEYLDAGGYGKAFRKDHLLPMAGAIWSASKRAILDYPAAAFIRFHHNHGLLKIVGRPIWHTVRGGSQNYVRAITSAYTKSVRTSNAAISVNRGARAVMICDQKGELAVYDHVVIATHADQALALLSDASATERKTLCAFRYSRNEAVLHSDPSLMPKREAVWSSWNYIEHENERDRDQPQITYWMNLLQNLPHNRQFFVTLNPTHEPRNIHHREMYEHPLFDTAALSAQKQLWSLQGERNTWFCGSYFGYGFHEDGLQSGLAVAEQLGGVKRPWLVHHESGRICISPHTAASKRELAA